MEGIFAQFIDGANSCRVPIMNISQRGVCFGYPSDKLEPFTGNLGLKIGGPRQNIKIQIKLLWRQLREDEQYVGAKVQNSPATWVNIISNLENTRISHAADRQALF